MAPRMCPPSFTRTPSPPFLAARRAASHRGVSVSAKPPPELALSVSAQRYHSQLGRSRQTLPNERTWHGNATSGGPKAKSSKFIHRSDTEAILHSRIGKEGEVSLRF